MLSATLAQFFPEPEKMNSLMKPVIMAPPPGFPTPGNFHLPETFDSKLKNDKSAKNYYHTSKCPPIQQSVM